MSGERLLNEEVCAGENLSGESEEADECMILAEAKRTNQNRKMQKDPSSGTFNLNCDDANGGEELEMIAESRKRFRELSCSSNRPGMRKACERRVNACLSCLQVKGTRKMKFPLKSVQRSEFNEVVQIDHQKVCMTETGYNQILVMIDHFTKLAEAVPCQTVSAEETCDHLITHWFSRYGCPTTFQSDNEKAFVGDVTKKLMKRSHIAQPLLTTYHPQTGEKAK